LRAIVKILSAVFKTHGGLADEILLMFKRYCSHSRKQQKSLLSNKEQAVKSTRDAGFAMNLRTGNVEFAVSVAK